MDFAKVQHALLSDRDGKVMQAFGVWNEKTRTARRSYIIIDKEGVVRYKNVRPTGAPKFLLSTQEILNEVKKINRGS